MKRTLIAVISLVVLAVLVVGTPVAMADKPQDAGSNHNDVIAQSNGFPSGPHFNLNIHGKNDSFICDPTAGGNSIFVDESGNATIEYVTNKKSSVEELTVLDPCAVDEGTAKVQLPHESLGYYVFARILAKPNNSSNDGEPSSIILYPNEVVEACNDPGNPDFGDYTECPDDPLLALGLIIKDAVYETDGEQFVRFEDPDAKGKGKSKAVDITRLFTFEGWVVDASLDTYPAPDGDGVIDVNDIPVADYDGDGTADQDCDQDGDVDEDDVEAWLTAMSLADPPMAWYFSAEDNMWILNIADLVVTEQGLVNDGTKLLQIRFYPVATTEFAQQ